MNQFILAFPIPCNLSHPFKITDIVQVESDTKTLMIPGCSIQFNVYRREFSPNLSHLFNEHKEISKEDSIKIDNHKSLLFLLGTIKSALDLRMINSAIIKVLSAGALGVYMQQSGTAWTKESFLEELDDESFPMDPWINYIQNDEYIYTLGLEIFGLPDLSLNRKLFTEEESRNILSVVSDSLFMGGISSKSLTEIDLSELGVFVLHSETKMLFSKNSPEYNKNGIMRLVKK